MAKQEQKKPNILVIMSDDIGIWNISAYHRGMMGGRTFEHRPYCAGRRVVHRLLRPSLTVRIVFNILWHGK